MSAPEFVSADRFVIHNVGPAAMVPGRVASLLDRELEPMRRRWRTEDQQVAAVLLAIHLAAMNWQAEHESGLSGNGHGERPKADTGALWGCEEVAGRLSLDQRSVRRAAAARELAGHKVAGRWLFTEAAISEYEETKSARRT